MQQEFDVQRDHVWLLETAGRLLAPGGTMLFSNNFQRFRLDAAALAPFEIEDITRATIPEDFARNPKIHVSYLLRRAAAALAGARDAAGATGKRGSPGGASRARDLLGKGPG